MLDARTEAIVKVSMLASRPSYRDELRLHLANVKTDALATREELYEAFLQLYLFAGFPAALEASRMLLRLFPVNKNEVNDNC